MFLRNVGPIAFPEVLFFEYPKHVPFISLKVNNALARFQYISIEDFECFSKVIIPEKYFSVFSFAPINSFSVHNSNKAGSIKN